MNFLFKASTSPRIPRYTFFNMRFSLLKFLPFVLCSAAGHVVKMDVNGPSQPRICPSLHVKGGGCIRCILHRCSIADVLDVRGFDVTSVTTEIDLTFPQIKNECDCIKACLDSKGTCNNYVWKFSTADSVKSGYRTCTLCTAALSRIGQADTF